MIERWLASAIRMLSKRSRRCPACTSPLRSVTGVKPYSSRIQRVQPSSMEGAQGRYNPTRGFLVAAASAGALATACMVTACLRARAAGRGAARAQRTMSPFGKPRLPARGQGFVERFETRVGVAAEREDGAGSLHRARRWGGGGFTNGPQHGALLGGNRFQDAGHFHPHLPGQEI